MKAKKKRGSVAKEPKKRGSVAKKPKKLPAPKHQPQAVPRGLSAADVRRVDTALRRFDKAQQVAADRGTDLRAVAEALGNAAVEKRLRELATQLAKGELLRDVLALKDAFAATSPDSLPAEIERLRLFPDALVQWLADSLGLSPSSEQGELEVPAAKLARFSCDFQPPEDADQLVRVRVTCRGWKRNGKSLIPTHVSHCRD